MSLLTSSKQAMLVLSIWFVYREPKTHKAAQYYKSSTTTVAYACMRISRAKGNSDEVKELLKIPNKRK